MKSISEILKEKESLRTSKFVSEAKIKTIENELTANMKHAFILSANEVCDKFVVTDEMRPILNNLCLYFLGLPGIYDLNKGIYLIGDYGVGKSTLMKCYRKWLSDWWPFNGNGFMVTSIEEIIEHYKKSGSLEKFTNNKEEEGFPNPRHLLINEFGKEIKDKIYGTEAEQIINSLMMLRYDIFQNMGKVTHITSNYYPKSQDLALSDRYVEMFNVININGNSFRK